MNEDCPHVKHCTACEKRAKLLKAIAQRVRVFKGDTGMNAVHVEQFVDDLEGLLK